jgi:DNA excision repair protein ERCC-2
MCERTLLYTCLTPSVLNTFVSIGQVSEGINFDRHYGRAVVMFGVPFQYTLSHVLRARLEFLQTHYQIREADFLNFDALRQTSQCVGRVIRSKTDYGLMILADSRYNRHDKRSKLPKWILQFLSEQYLNLSTDMAMSHIRAFLRLMGQPIDQEALQSVLLTVDEAKAMNPVQKISGAIAGEGGAMIVDPEEV